MKNPRIKMVSQWALRVNCSGGEQWALGVNCSGGERIIN